MLCSPVWLWTHCSWGWFSYFYLPTTGITGVCHHAWPGCPFLSGHVSCTHSEPALYMASHNPGMCAGPTDILQLYKHPRRDLLLVPGPSANQSWHQAFQPSLCDSRAAVPLSRTVLLLLKSLHPTDFPAQGFTCSKDQSGFVEMIQHFLKKKNHNCSTQHFQGLHSECQSNHYLECDTLGV